MHSLGDSGAPGSDGASAFETIRHVDSAGGEWWSARELMPVLTYTTWRRFADAVHAAMRACEAASIPVSDHFDVNVKMIPLGKGATRRVDDWRLSRYACYLLVMNGDSSKPVIALGQTYFAVQTERARLAGLADSVASDALAGLSEAQRRLVARAELAERNTSLAGAAYDAGVLSSRDFAIFQDHGYAGLYGGERARDIAARKQIPRNGRILDYMGAEELADNLFRVMQTEAKLQRDGVQGKDAANRTHYDVGAAVRRFIVDDLGGVAPEGLPTPSESIAQVRARERERERREGRAQLRDGEDGDAGGDAGRLAAREGDGGDGARQASLFDDAPPGAGD